MPMKTGWTWRTLSLLVCDMALVALELYSYKIYNTIILEIFQQCIGEKFNGLTASWIEVVAGIKAKVFVTYS
jgi:hypothetical protein